MAKERMNPNQDNELKDAMRPVVRELMIELARDDVAVQQAVADAVSNAPDPPVARAS